MYLCIYLGLCKDSKLDEKYGWTSEVSNNFYLLRGYNEALLEKGADGSWRILLYSSNGTFATTNATSDYPLGQHQWEVRGDPCFGGDAGSGVQVTLSLDACTPTEYNCMDGQCIGMEKRCNGVIDCKDLTDEVGCTVYEKSRYDEATQQYIK